MSHKFPLFEFTKNMGERATMTLIRPLTKNLLELTIFNMLNFLIFNMCISRESRRNTWTAAQEVYLLLKSFMSTYGIPAKQIHLIGHSLGSHVSGMAGKRMFAETGQKIGRISALDPAAPSYLEGPQEGDFKCLHIIWIICHISYVSIYCNIWDTYYREIPIRPVIYVPIVPFLNFGLPMTTYEAK